MFGKSKLYSNYGRAIADKGPCHENKGAHTNIQYIHYTHTHTHTHTQRKKEKERDRQTNRQTDRQTDRFMDRQAQRGSNLWRPVEGKIDAGIPPRIVGGGCTTLFFFFPAVPVQPAGGHDRDVPQGLEEVKGHWRDASLTDVLHVEEAACVLPLRIHVVLTSRQESKH